MRKPLSRLSNRTRWWRRRCLTHSCPFRQSLTGYGKVRADFQKGGPPVSIMDVEVEMFDRYGLSGEVDRHTAARRPALVRFEGAHLLLRDPHERHLPGG